MDCLIFYFTVSDAAGDGDTGVHPKYLYIAQKEYEFNSYNRNNFLTHSLQIYKPV